MTSPPAQHDPPNDGPGREDADAHPPLGQVEAGPQRHSDDPFHVMARNMVRDSGLGFLNSSYFDGIVWNAAETLRGVDRAAREDCAGVATRILMRENAPDRGTMAARVGNAILQTIKD